MFHGCTNRGHRLSKVIQRYLAVALVLALFVPFLCNTGVVKAEGTTVTWTGGAGTSDWHTAGNWDTGQVPATGDTVVIPVGSSVNYTTGTSSVTLQCAGDLTVSGGALETTGTSTISGSLVNNGSVVINKSELTLSGGGEGSGDFTLKGMAHLKFAGSKSFTVGGKADDLGGSGSLTVSEAGTTVTFNGQYKAATTSVNNGASATWNGATAIEAFNNFGNAVFNRNITLYTLYSTSTGTIDGSGDITISKECSSNQGWGGGTIKGTGTLIVESSGVFTLTGGIEKNLKRKLINNGTVKILGGTANFHEPVENRGQLSISKDTPVYMSKGYTQTEAGTLSFDIGGDNAFKQLAVAQALSLAGELHVELVNNYTPAAGRAFQLLGYPTGIAPGPDNRFAAITSSNSEISFEATYNSNDLTLTVAGVEQAAAPTANPVAGTYTEAQNVALTTTTAGANIYYTTDGSQPTTASTQYTAPIAVSASTTIKAIAVKTGMADCPVATFAYVIEEPADTAPPVVETYTPENGAVDVALDTNALVLKFNEPVWGVNNKALSIYEKRNGWNDSMVGSVFAQNPDSAVMTGNGTTTITFNISSVSLGLGKEYYVKIAQGAFRDAVGNEYAGIDDTTTWTFQTIADTQPPTVPANLRCVSKTTSSVELAWDASTDDYGPIRYNIYVKNGAEYDFVGELDTNSFTVTELTGPTPLTPNTTYTFVIRALDGKNNPSEYSNELSVTTLAVASTDAEITAYSLAEQTALAAINTTAGTVGIEVAHGTDVTNLVATFTLSAGASAKVGTVEQVSGTTANDFTNPVTYTVTAEDGSTTKPWTVTVTVAAETTPPVWSADYPKAVDATASGFTIKAKINEAGTAYHVVLNHEATAPSAAQVKAGQDSSGNSVVEGRKGSINLIANTEGSAVITGLTSETAYDIYVVAEGAANNLQTIPVKLDITTLRVPSSDADAVAAAKASLTWDTVKGTNSSEYSITTGLNLPALGDNGTTISWSANPTGWINTASGAVTRPTATQGDQTVTLTATISKGSASDNKSFTLIIKATAPEQTADEAIALDMAALTWNVIKGANSSQTNVTSKLVLPTSGANGTTISWSAGPTGLVNTSTGAVTRPSSSQGNKTVTLTATVSRAGGTSRIKDFVLSIIALSDSGSGGGGGSVTTYTISVTASIGGTITPKTIKVKTNDSQTFTITPDPGYEIEDVLVDGKSIGTKTSYTFKKVTGGHTISAIFKKLQKTVEDMPVIELPFKDVQENNWFFNSIKYAYKKGLMQGTGPDTFSPFLNTSRAMIVTILHRLEETPAGLENTFSDVAGGTWYKDAVAWAAANGIVGGYGGNLFGPNDSITREQVACILYRYAKYAGHDVTQFGALAVFTDGSETSSWAVEAMQWAVGSGLIQGKDGNILDPAGLATRAEAATILQRFIENNKK